MLRGGSPSAPRSRLERNMTNGGERIRAARLRCKKIPAVVDGAKGYGFGEILVRAARHGGPGLFVLVISANEAIWAGLPGKTRATLRGRTTFVVSSAQSRTLRMSVEDYP